MTHAAKQPANSRLQGLSPAAMQGVVSTAQALELGRVDEAGRHIAALLASYPHHPEILRLLAGLQSMRGDGADAAATMRQALALRPDDALYLNTLGSVLTETGEYDEAIAVLRRACNLDPGLAVAWFNLGVALTRCMRPAEAADAMRRAVALAPGQVNARCLLADQLKASGRTDEAVAEFRHARASPDRGHGVVGPGRHQDGTLRRNRHRADRTGVAPARNRRGRSQCDGFRIGKGARRSRPHGRFAGRTRPCPRRGSDAPALERDVAPRAGRCDAGRVRSPAGGR